MTRNDNEWYRVVNRVTTSATKKDPKWQRMTMNKNEWKRMIILANFSFARVIKEPTTLHTKENSFNIEDNLEWDNRINRRNSLVPTILINIHLRFAMKIYPGEGTSRGILFQLNVITSLIWYFFQMSISLLCI